MIEQPLHDNRDYEFSENYNEIRNEYHIILDFIPSNAKVIDLGCGDGKFLSLLKSNKNIFETGLDISSKAIEICKSKNLNVFKNRIDEVLNFADNSFDFSICNVTIQMVNYPEILLSEMKRISKYQIISFPNFAFYKNRLDLLFKGRMPKPMLFNYRWFNTGHIHQFSIKDFFELINVTGGLSVLRMDFYKTQNPLKNFFMKSFPNLFIPIPIFLLTKNA
jgi:methionine biosynthesis protein MetW